MNHTKFFAVPTLIACTLNIAQLPEVLAASVNTTNYGKNINAGTYYNTRGGRTSFVNRNGGLLLKKGDLVRGLQSDANGNPTGHGGSLYFRAPRGVVRFDGDIDVSALRNGNGLYLGNGGQVFVDGRYLYQNGNIWANGVNGGLVQFNVGAATLGPNARIEAMGFGGNGGTININASGAVDIQRGAVLDVSGKVAGTYDTSIINIEGGLVNNEGILRANGIASADTKPDNGDQDLISQGDYNYEYQYEYEQNEGGTGSNGGTIRLVATGNTSKECFDCAVDAGSDVLSASEQTELKQRNAELVDSMDGAVNNSGLIQANGANGEIVTNTYTGEGYWEGETYYPGPTYTETYATEGKNGGTVIIAAKNGVTNSGTIEANGGNGTTLYQNSSEGEEVGSEGEYSRYSEDHATSGGNGGTISLTTLGKISNSGLIQANGGQGGGLDDQPAEYSNSNSYEYNYNYEEDGNYEGSTYTYTSVSGASGARGGNGGAIAFGYNEMENSGRIEANGGNGGNGQQAIAESTAEGYYGANASASAYGGQGGQGGKGGLVVFSGPENPTGGGVIEANGGNGGNGGAASATSTAYVSYNNEYSEEGGGWSSAYAYAYGGSGGGSGGAGLIVVPDPESLHETQDYSSKNGQHGGSGQAYAEANTYGESGYYESYVYAQNEGGSSQAWGSGSISATQNATSPYGDDDGNHLDQTQANELILHGPNAILLSRNWDEGGTESYLSDRLYNATTRTVDDPYGEEHSSEDLLDDNYPNVRNFVVHGGSEAGLNLDIGTEDVYNPGLAGLNTLTVLNNGDVYNDTTWNVGHQKNRAGGYYYWWWYYDPYLYTNHISRSGGHLSIVADGSIYNTGVLKSTGDYVGGSVNLAATHDILNLNNGYFFGDYYSDDYYEEGGGFIGTYVYGGYSEYDYGLFSHGGSVNLNAGGNILNLFGEISANNYNEEGSIGAIGGTIRLRANDSILNIGTISSNASAQNYDYSENGDGSAYADGGVIDAKAGNLLINLGSISANGEASVYRYVYTYNGEEGYWSYQYAPGEGNGGDVLLHAGNVVANGLPFEEDYDDYEEASYFPYWFNNGYISANGNAQGGQVILTAGGNPSEVPDLFGNVNGTTFTNGTFPFGGTFTSGINTLVSESAYNFGSIYANEYSESGSGNDGSIILAANNQIGIGPYAEFFGTAWDPGMSPVSNLSNIQSNGGSLTLIAGPTAVDQVLCGLSVNTPSGGADTAEEDSFLFDINGLFQAARLQNLIAPDSNIGAQGPVLAYQSANMFLSADYKEVSSNILESALMVYNLALKNGASEQGATDAAVNYLAGLGIDQEFAKELVQKIQNGELHTSDKVVAFLNILAEKGASKPSNGFDAFTETNAPGALGPNQFNQLLKQEGNDNSNNGLNSSSADVSEPTGLNTP